MAIASCSVKIISRGKGRSAVAAAAYRSAVAMANSYDGKSHDYSHKTGVVYSSILLPEGAPVWMQDQETFWNFVEKFERRKDSQLAREVMIALPNELTRGQNVELAVEYARIFVVQGMVADVSVHDNGDGNPHAHILLTMRPLEGDSFGKKCLEWNKTDKLIEWRMQYAELTNQYLERYGYDQRIDARSYATQGIDQVPTIHLGSYAHRLEQMGVQTERGDINRRIVEQNKEMEEISRQKEAYQKDEEQLKNEIVQEQSQKQEEIEKQRVEAQKPAEPEPASNRYNRFLERYVRVAQSIHRTEEALQDLLTEKGIKDFAAQEKNIEDVREPLPQPIQEPETPSYHTGAEESERKQQLDYDTVTKKQEKGPPPYHPRIEEQDRKRQLQQEYDALYDAAKQKRKEHRLVREPERQNRRYQSAYERAEERERKISRREQTTDHRRPEPPKPERQPDFQEQYKIAERRHHELERQKRRYSRSRDDPEHEK